MLSLVIYTISILQTGTYVNMRESVVWRLLLLTFSKIERSITGRSGQNKETDYGQAYEKCSGLPEHRTPWGA